MQGRIAVVSGSESLMAHGSISVIQVSADTPTAPPPPLPALPPGIVPPLLPPPPGMLSSYEFAFLRTSSNLSCFPRVLSNKRAHSLSDSFHFSRTLRSSAW